MEMFFGRQWKFARESPEEKAAREKKEKTENTARSIHEFEQKAAEFEQLAEEAQVQRDLLYKRAQGCMRLKKGRPLPPSAARKNEQTLAGLKSKIVRIDKQIAKHKNQASVFWSAASRLEGHQGAQELHESLSVVKTRLSDHVPSEDDMHAMLNEAEKISTELNAHSDTLAEIQESMDELSVATSLGNDSSFVMDQYGLDEELEADYEADLADEAAAADHKVQSEYDAQLERLRAPPMYPSPPMPPSAPKLDRGIPRPEPEPEGTLDWYYA